MRFTKQTTHRIHSRDLEEFVESQFPGTGFNFNRDQEWGDGHSVYGAFTFDVNDGIYDPHDPEIVEEFKVSGFGVQLTGILLNHFARQGLIPTGNYIVEPI